MHDRHGEYYSLTGFEAPGKCFWCGEEVKGYRRYCKGGKHKRLYMLRHQKLRAEVKKVNQDVLVAQERGQLVLGGIWGLQS